MSENLQHIDDLFRNGMEGKEEMPAPLNWEKISRQLDEKDRRRPLLYFRLSGKAAAIALILLGSATLFAGGYLLRGYIAQKEKEDIPVINKDMTRKSPPSGTAPLAGDTTIEEVLITEEVPDPLENSPEPPPPSQQAETIQPETFHKEGLRPNPAKGNQADQPLPSEKAAVPSLPVQEPTASALELATVDENIPSATSANLPVAVRTEKQILTPSVILNTPAQASAPAEASIPVATKNKPSVNQPRFTLMPVAQFQSGNVRLDADDRLPTGPAFRREISASEKVRFTEGFGVMASFRLSKTFSIQSGFVTNGKETTIRPRAIRAERRPDGQMRFRLESSAGTVFIDPKSGTSPNAGDSINTLNVSTKTTYVQIPVQLNYHIGTGKVQGFLTAGTGIQLLGDHQVSVKFKHDDDDDDHGKRDRDIRLKNSYLNGIIGGGIRWNITRHAGLQLSPQYQFALSPSNKGMLVSTLPRTFTVQAGLTLHW